MIMGFKEIVAADIDRVFLNPNEFGEMHRLDDVELCAVISTNQTKQRSKVQSRNFEGLHGEFMTVNIKKSDFPRIPKQGENIRLDGKLYKVSECRDNMGMLYIELAAYRMGGAG